MTIQEAIKQLSAAGTEIYCKICTIDAVDVEARTVDCSPLDESAPLVGVNLQANQDAGTGVVAIPAPGSYVVVGFLSPSAAVVILTEKIDRYLVDIGDAHARITDGQIDIAVKDTTVKVDSSGIVMNGGGLGGLVKIQELTDKLNELIDAFNAHTHEIATGGIAVTGSATAQSNATPVSVPAIIAKQKHVSVSDYENPKIKQ